MERCGREGDGGVVWWDVAEVKDMGSVLNYAVVLHGDEGGWDV